MPTPKKDPEAVKARIRKHTKTWALKSKYGLTPEHRDAIVIQQLHKCAICEEPLSDNPRLVHIDHCHSTNKLRGILCSNCNHGIGKFKESPERMLRAIAYLEFHQ
jgi:DNA-directed RNA polymerase subunit RPC12/RpoP